MPMQLKISEILAEAPRLVASGISYEFIGPPGCGKTELCFQIGDLMTKLTSKPFGISTFNASTALPITVPGFPLFSQKNERGTRTTEHTEPVWMTCLNGKSVHEYDQGMLIIDERRSAEGDIKKQLGDLMLNKRAGNHALPPGWIVWTTGNRANDRSGATKDYDFIVNRHVEVHIRQDIQDIVDRYNIIGVHPTIISFFNDNPTCIIHDTVPDVQGPWCTPRSGVLADRLLKQFIDPATPDKLPMTPFIGALLEGLIGEGAAMQLSQYVQIANASVQFTDIIANPKTCRVPERPDMQMLVCHMAASRVDKKNVNQVTEYIMRLPQEFGTTFVRSALKRDIQLLNTQAFSIFCAQNASLLALIASLK